MSTDHTDALRELDLLRWTFDTQPSVVARIDKIKALLASPTVAPADEREAFEKWATALPADDVLKQERAVGFREGYELAQSRAALPAWIPVSERLPPDRVSVLAWDGDHIATATLYGKDWGSITHMQSITHWMPLPTAPDVNGAKS